MAAKNTTKPAKKTAVAKVAALSSGMAGKRDSSKSKKGARNPITATSATYAATFEVPCGHVYFSSDGDSEGVCDNLWLKEEEATYGIKIRRIVEVSHWDSVDGDKNEDDFTGYWEQPLPETALRFAPLGSEPVLFVVDAYPLRLNRDDSDTTTVYELVEVIGAKLVGWTLDSQHVAGDAESREAWHASDEWEGTWVALEAKGGKM